MQIWIELYILIGLAFFLLCFYEDGQRALLHLVIVLTLPGLGFVLILLTELSKRCWDRAGTIRVWTEAGPNRDSPAFFRNRYEPQKELNLVPFEEALLINTSAVKKGMLLDILKADTAKYPGLIKLALENEDTETAHYAAAAAAELKSRLIKAVQECLYDPAGISGADSARLSAAASSLREYLSCGFFERAGNRDMRDRYADVLTELIRRGRAEERHYSELVCLLIEKQDYEKALQYCGLFAQKCCGSENPGLLYLKLCYAQNKREDFSATLQEMIKKTAWLSEQARGQLAFWLPAE